jgi:hypothetical protein
MKPAVARHDRLKPVIECLAMLGLPIRPRHPLGQAGEPFAAAQCVEGEDIGVGSNYLVRRAV